MALSAFAPHLTLDDYARIEAESEVRHEFYDGDVFAMAGGRRAHSVLCANIVGELHGALRGRSCRVFTSDCRVMSPPATEGMTGTFTYPDASVASGEVQFGPPADTLLNPVALVEVLSPSTEAYGRGDKFRVYRRIPTLNTVVYVSSVHRAVEVFERDEAGVWSLHEPEGDAVALRHLGVTLSFDTLYDGVELDMPAPPPAPDPADLPPAVTV